MPSLMKFGYGRIHSGSFVGGRNKLLSLVLPLPWRQSLEVLEIFPCFMGDGIL